MNPINKLEKLYLDYIGLDSSLNWFHYFPKISDYREQACFFEHYRLATNLDNLIIVSFCVIDKECIDLKKVSYEEINLKVPYFPQPLMMLSYA